MNIIKINVGTLWEMEFDNDIKIGDHVECNSSSNGKTRGFWRVVERNEVVVDTKEVAQKYGRHKYIPGATGYQREFPPLGMTVKIELKLMRVMTDDFEKPYRRDTTRARIENCESIDQKYYDVIKNQYDKNLVNLSQLISGTWLV